MQKLTFYQKLVKFGNGVDVGNGVGVKNISDLVLKKIYGIYETKNLTKEQIKKYKMTEREFFEKSYNLYNLNEDELNTKSNKKVCVRNVITAVIKRFIGEKRGRRAIDGFRKNRWLQILKSLSVQNLKSDQQ